MALIKPNNLLSQLHIVLLKPFFGTYGSEGPVAYMHLGRRALVSAKTKESKKVYTLYFDRVALLRSSRSEHTWKMDGAFKTLQKMKCRNQVMEASQRLKYLSRR